MTFNLPLLMARVALAVPCLLVSGVAFAQSDATAELLFRDGKKLLAEKKYDEACPKFAESARIAPSSGVQLALGLCYEAEGKTASAWGAFTAVITLARRDARKDREKAAAAHAKLLEPKLARVSFQVDAASAAREGFELHEDGITLGSAAWADAPVDPGEHRVEVVTPGYVSYTTTFTVTDGTTQTVTIPALEALPATVSLSALPPPTQSEATPWRTIAFATGGLGAVTVVAGAVLGAIAIGKVNDAKKLCPTTQCNDASAVSENMTGGTFADASTGLFVGGGVLAGAAILTYFLAPSSRPASTKTAYGAPLVGPGVVGWQGSF